MARTAKSAGTQVSPGRPPRRRRRRLRRFILVSLTLLVLLVGGLTVMAPAIAGALAPGIIERGLNPRLRGSVEVSDVSLRWLRAGRPARTAAIVLYDDRRVKVAEVTLESQLGILGLLGGIGDLGEFVVTGSADVVRHADGKTNIERIFEPLISAPGEPSPAPSEGGTPSLPARLSAVLRIASLTGTYTDESFPTPLRVTLESMAGRAAFATGHPAELTLDMAVVTGGQRGTLAVRGNVDRFSTAEGALTPARATANITATARDLPIGVADSIAGLGGSLTRAIGGSLRFDLSVQGTMEQGTARVALATDGGAAIGGALRFQDSVLLTTEPLTITLDTARAAAADPAIAAALTEGDAARITMLPTLSATLSDLRIPVPTGGAALDLRGARATFTAALGETAGTLAVPGREDRSIFRMTPMSVVLRTDDLAGALTLVTSTDAFVDGRSAGTLRVDVSASGLLDSSGAVRPALPAIGGTVVLDEFTVAIVQPILDALAPDLGLSLTEALGPTLGIHLALVSESTPPAAPAPEIPPTLLNLSVASDNVTAGGRLRVAQDEVRTLDERGLWLRIGSVARILGTMLEGAGLTVASGGEVNLAITDLFLADPMAEAPPLDRARARLTLGVSETRGQLLAGPGPTNYRVDPGRIALFIDGARDTIEVAGRIDALITGDARIATQIDTTLSGLLGQIGGKAQPATSTGQGLRITMTEVGRWLAAVLPADAPVRVENSGQVTIALGGLAIAPSPARPAGPSLGKAPATPDILHRITASLEVGASGLRFAPTLQPETPGAAPPAPEMIEVGSFAITAGLSPAAAPSLTLDSAYTVSAQQFKIGGTLALARPLSGISTMREMVPRGRIALDQVPVELLRLLPLEIAGAAGEPVNITALVGEAVGRKIDVVLGLLAPPRNQPADHTNVALRIIGRGTRLDASGVINAEGFAAGETVLAATLTPRLLQLVQNAFAPDLEHKPRLTENASVRITVAPMLIPLDESLAPRPGATVPIRAVIESGMTIDNLVLASDAGGRPINAGPVQVEGLRATASLPIALGEVSGSAPAPMSVEFALGGRRPGRADARLFGVSGTAAIGAVMDVRATLTELDLAWLDGAIGQPGLISGALGPRAGVVATFSGDPQANAGATLSLTAQNLTMAQPVRVALTPAAISLSAPISATFTATPEWATRYIFGQTGAEPPMVRVDRAIPFTLSVPALAITRGEGRGPLVPGEWGIDATITTPEISVRLRDDAQLRYLNPEFIVRTARNEPRRINTSVRMTEARAVATPTAPPAGGGAAPPDPAQNLMRISVMNLMDDAGQINLAGATAEAVGRIPGFPTELLDALAQKRGLLAELLGPAVTLDVTARNVPLAFAAPPAAPVAGAAAPATPPAIRGRVEADLRSDRARARLAGTIDNMVMTTSEPLAVDLTEITRAFSQMVADGMPLVSTFEKPRSLRPATLRGEGLTLPMDGNLANLNGRFSVDPGEIQFASSNLLGSMLKVAGGQSSGVAGRRLQPFTFTIASGVVSYDRFALPLGEFTVSTTGKVDLVAQRMDLLVYIPVGAVADDALGAFNIGLGSSLSQLAPGFDGSLPFRLRGPFGSARPEPAIDVFVQEFGSRLINPGNLLERFLPRPGGGGGGGLPFQRGRNGG